MNPNDIFFIEWQDPQTKAVLMVKYMKPWRWDNIIEALKQAEGYFKSIAHKAVIVHDQTKFPAQQSTIGAIRDLWGKIPPPPTNLIACIIVTQNQNYFLRVAFDVVEKTFFGRKITYFVTTLEEVKQFLASSKNL